MSGSRFLLVCLERVLIASYRREVAGQIEVSRNRGDFVNERPVVSPEEGHEVSEELPEAAMEHPKGTLAIVLIYAALFALGWIALYFGEFIPRGAPQP